MKSPIDKILLAGLGLLLLGGVSRAQDPATGQSALQRQPMDGRDHGRPRPTVGQITAIGDGSMELSRPDGSTVTVKVTDKTEFRKDRQPAKLSDFKVGDVVGVRGQEGPDHSITAESVGSRSGGSMGAGPSGGGPIGPLGAIGKDFVAGEVKSVDAPKITVLRMDNQTQTIELNEETSLRKGRESVTMADIQVGDHVFARGGVQNQVFVPKTVMVFDAEQWKRLQELRQWAQPAGAAPKSDAPRPKPTEQPN